MNEYISKFTGGGGDKQDDGQRSQEGGSNSSGSNSGGGGGGFMDKLNGMAGGGKESEKNEDYLDKGVDFVQEKFFGAGDQSNESAVEQAKDEQISDFIRGKYKTATGSDFPIADKDKDYGRPGQ